MFEQLLEMLRMIEESDELFSISAGIMRKSWEALVAAGFSEDQATTIVAGQGSGVKTS